MIDHLDHPVLTTAGEAECIRFYTQVLGMQMESFIGTPPIERKAFKFGKQKINLHVKGREFEPKAHTPVPGALDLCFIAAVAHSFGPCAEDVGVFLLLVWWRSIEAHVVEFRQSADHALWRSLLQSQLQSEPWVRHFEVSEGIGQPCRPTEFSAGGSGSAVSGS